LARILLSHWQEELMNGKQIVLFALFGAAILFEPLGLSAEEGQRAVLFQLGAGPAYPAYPAQTETVLSYAEAQAGVERMKLSLDLALGIALNQQGFLMARIDGTGDRLYDSSDYLQLNLYLYSLGLRYYPLTTGFYLDAGGGASRAVIQASTGETYASEVGFGYGLAAGYDFNVSPRGFGLSLEARYLGLEIDSDQASAFMLTIDLCWK
jgi:hypothetical protein